MALVATGAAILLTSSSLYYYFSEPNLVENPTTIKEIRKLKNKNMLPNQKLLEELRKNKKKLKPVSVEKSLKNSACRLEKLITELREKVKLQN